MKGNKYEEYNLLLEDARKEVIEAELNINKVISELEETTLRTRTEINSQLESIKFWSQRVKELEEKILLLGADY